MRPIIADILQGKIIGTSPPARIWVCRGSRPDRDPQVRIANGLYREVIPRELTRSTELGLTPQAVWYMGPDRRLGFPGLLAAFQQYFRENSEVWMGGDKYRKAGAQLLMQTFLQRLVNGDGRIDARICARSGRVDLCVRWPLDQTRGP